MTRKELIEKAAAERAAAATEDKGLRYLDFVNTAEWADRTMIDKACEWLQCIDFEVEYFTIDSDGYTFFNADKFIEDFCKTMEG